MALELDGLPFLPPSQCCIVFVGCGHYRWRVRPQHGGVRFLKARIPPNHAATLRIQVSGHNDEKLLTARPAKPQSDRCR